jgi:hypothetical protein
MDVIDTYCEVRLPEKVREGLATTPLELPAELEGSATTPAGRALNRLKNRSEPPQETDLDPTATLEAMLAPGPDENRFSPLQAAKIRGFVISVRKQGMTSANFRRADARFRGTHIMLGLSKDAPPHRRVLAVVTPRLRDKMKEKGLDWSAAALRSPTSGIVGKKVELTGWLLFNLAHMVQAANTNPGGSHNWRATCWEIHPVTDIKLVNDPAPPQTK